MFLALFIPFFLLLTINYNLASVIFEYYLLLNFHDQVLNFYDKKIEGQAIK